LFVALLTGRLDSVEREVLLVSAAERKAAAAGLAPDPEWVQEALNAFRYDCDLISGDETERWLTARCLDWDGLLARFERRFFRERFCRGT
jgi:hypothetical protein